MLKPAFLYKDEIYKRFAELKYSKEMFLYTGYFGNSIPTIDAADDGLIYQYAIVDNNRLIGYFTYQIDWYTSCANCFGLVSFDKNNRIIGLDAYRELKRIIAEYNLHRIEWRMVGGNPVEKHYDKFCKRYNGRKILLYDAIKDKYGNYHNDIIYEIVF